MEYVDRLIMQNEGRYRKIENVTKSQWITIWRSYGVFRVSFTTTDGVDRNREVGDENLTHSALYIRNNMICNQAAPRGTSTDHVIHDKAWPLA
jgi:hypothetical protein